MLLTKVDLNQYEGRIKRFCYHSTKKAVVTDEATGERRTINKLVPGEKITLKQMKKAFETHPVLSQILDDNNSIDRKLLLHSEMYFNTDVN